MAFDLTKPVTVNGVTYEPTDLNQMTLLVIGVQPTNYDKWKRLNVLALHNNVKQTADGDKSGGRAQSVYLYDELDDLDKFHEYKYPYYLPVVATKTANMKGELDDLILHVDFANITELDLVPRNQKPTNAAPTAPVAKP